MNVLYVYKVIRIYKDKYLCLLEKNITNNKIVIINLKYNSLYDFVSQNKSTFFYKMVKYW